jgi:hypothetical protein
MTADLSNLQLVGRCGIAPWAELDQFEGRGAFGHLRNRFGGYRSTLDEVISGTAWWFFGSMDGFAKQLLEFCR